MPESVSFIGTVIYVFPLQDPTSLDKFNLANFHHLKNNLKVVNTGQCSG